MQAYTADQLELFLGAAIKQETERMRHHMIAARTAQADAKDFKRALKELD